MSGLVVILLGLAAWLAERGSRSLRRGRLDRRLGRRPERMPLERMRAPAGWVVWSVVAGAVTWLLFGPVAGFVGGVAGGVAWHVRRRRRARSCAAERDEQVVDAVVSLTAAIRAGQSVPQALAFAANESVSPARDSIRRLDESFGQSRLRGHERDDQTQ